MPDFGLTDAGYVAPRAADFLTTIRSLYNQELLALGYTEMPDYGRDTFLGASSEIMAFLLGQVGEATQAIYDARSVANATGLQLASLALIVGVPRNEATHGTVTLTLTGDDGTPITQGKIVQGGGPAGTSRWVCTQDVVIGSTTSGEIDAIFQAEDEGQIIATPGTITTIVTPVAGWDAVTNAASASPGRERETDSALRARRQRAIQGAGSTNTAAILAALLDLDFVAGATVVDNKTEDEVVTDGLTLRPYSVGCVVAPSTLTDAQKAQVVEAIYRKTGGGTDTSGDSTGTVTKRDGRSETIRYTLAANSSVNVAFVLVLSPGFVIGDVEDALEDLVVEYLLTLTTGSTVYPTPLIALAATVEGIANVTSLLINGSAVPLTHTAVQLPVLGTFSATT